MVRIISEPAGRQLLKAFADEVSDGQYEGVLTLKIWGKSANIRLLFALDSGENISVRCSRSSKDPAVYGPKDQSINFAVDGNEGMRFALDISASKQGVMTLNSASLVRSLIP